MWHWSVQADVVTYNAAISACEKGQQWASALNLLGQMWHWSVQANVVTYSAAISACERGQQWASALELLGKIQ